MRINRKFLSACRTVHIYLTMLGLAVMFLFGLTGFTVNHEDWFGATIPLLRESSGQTPMKLIEAGDRLGIVEHLRSQFRIGGALSGYDDLEASLSIGFKTPGQIWEVSIDKKSGTTNVHEETFNFTAIINNLHRGRYSGPAWKWVIDISAILIVIACITGVVLWLALPKRRKWGIASLVVGTLGTIAIYAMLVPGPDPGRLTSPDQADVGAETGP